tara:strand:+ start:379 stop:615 length:237 start_codon:yes stop_codon:yes gene_type:complete
VKLSAAQINQKLIITGIKASKLRPKLNELGIIDGKEISIIIKAPFSGPIAIKVDESILSIRKEDTENIEVDTINDGQK